MLSTRKSASVIRISMFINISYIGLVFVVVIQPSRAFFSSFRQFFPMLRKSDQTVPSVVDQRSDPSTRPAILDDDHPSAKTDNAPQFVNFLVGGMAHSIRTQDIRKHPNSYFSAVIDKQLHLNEAGGNGFVTIDRDGDLFRHVSDFHFYNKLIPNNPRLSVERIQSIQAEADFYILPDLRKACEQRLVRRIDYKYATECVYESDNPEDLVNQLSSIWAPFCAIGSYIHRDSFWNGGYLFGNFTLSSTLNALNLTELKEEAVQSPYGRVRNSFEIPAAKLDADTLASLRFDLKEFAPRMKLEIRPYKLVISEEGSLFDELRDSVRGENHIGTLVYILNSEFTGELVVRQNNKKKSISKPGEWMAMYNDCPLNIQPVAFGTRVSLLFDLYQVGTVPPYEDLKDMPCEIAEEGCERQLSTTARKKIIVALDKELENYSSVTICLAHLYPVYQASASGLKGGDAALHALLHETGKYTLSLVPTNIHLKKNYHCTSTDARGSIANLHSKIELKCDDEKSDKTKLIIPVSVTPEVDYLTELIEREWLDYFTTGLRVEKKKPFKLWRYLLRSKAE